MTQAKHRCDMAAGESDRKEQAKALFMLGTSISEIARQLDMSRRQVQRWKEDGNWEALKASITPPKPAPAKIIDLHAPRPERPEPMPRPRRQLREGEELDLLQTVELAIADGAALITTCSDMNDTKGFGGVAGGLCRLIELRLKLKPVEEAALIEQLLERGLSPRELVARLKEAGWSRPA